MQQWRQAFAAGAVIPAHPLALTQERKLDERRQRALTRYYLASGAGGIAAGVHTTQFAIHDNGMLRPVLELAAEEMRDSVAIRIAGVCGPTKQAEREATLARDLGYHAVLLSLAALPQANLRKLTEHVETVADIAPVIGFYLQPAVGGRYLPIDFWRKLTTIENVVGIKIAPFNRYMTLDVLRAVAESDRRNDIALYTGNDDNILCDLATSYRFGGREVRMRGGLLGHWAVWTSVAVRQLAEIRAGELSGDLLLTRNAEVTDSNAAFFDAANNFHGCIAGLHEVLRRQGMLEGTWCLNPAEDLSPGQAIEIDRVYRAYPHLSDDAFVASHRDMWLR